MSKAITTEGQVIEELVALAKELDAASKRCESLSLSDDEVAFYDALAANDSAVQAMGDARLKVIAAELITQVLMRTRELFIRQGVLAKQDNQVELLHDHEFMSPSQAAGLLLARSADGRLDWKDAAGITLKEHQERAPAASELVEP